MKCSLDSFSDVRHQSTSLQDVIDDTRVRAGCIGLAMNQKPSRPGIDLNLITSLDTLFQLGEFINRQSDVDGITVKNTGDTDRDHT